MENIIKIIIIYVCVFTFTFTTIIYLYITIKFNKLIKSDRYKNSNYRIEKYGNHYVIKNKTTGKFVVIENPYLIQMDECDSDLTHGSEYSVVKAFNLLLC